MTNVAFPKVECKQPMRALTALEGISVTDELNIVCRDARQIGYQCGHKFARDFQVNFYGQVFDRQAQQTRNRVYCGDCTLKIVQKYFRRCAVCRRVIMVDRSVAFGPTCSKPALNLSGIVIVKTTTYERLYMSCALLNCTTRQIEFQGRWTRNGFVYEKEKYFPHEAEQGIQIIQGQINPERLDCEIPNG